MADQECSPAEPFPVISKDQAEVSAAALDVQNRIRHCLIRAIRLQGDQTQPQVVRDVAQAYIHTLCRDRVVFLRSILRYLDGRQMDLPVSGPYCLEELMVHPPARWEFEHLDLFGTIGSAISCAGRYRTCDKFIAVHPIELDDPLISDIEPRRIPLRHKPSSPWYQGFSRRMQLKHQLGTARSLVGYARKMNKSEFLEQFLAKPGETVKMVDRKGRPYTRIRLIPDIPPHRLLNLTGYTPEEFWREVRKPNTVKPHKPQLELFQITF